MTPVTQMELKNVTEGHIFYRFQEVEPYIDHLISFIQTGIDQNEQIFIIDSMRNLPIIFTKINSIFTIEQQATIHLANNYDYFLSNGDFHTQTILNHFQKDLSLFKRDNSSIRTWAQVEWVSNENNAKLLKDFKFQSDDFVIQEQMVSVCAYSSAHLSDSLDEALKQINKYCMTDENFSLSPSYFF